MNRMRTVADRMGEAMGNRGDYPTVPLAYEEIRVAVVQMKPRAIDSDNPQPGIDANVEHMRYLCDMAERWPPNPQGVQLIAFPEFCINSMDTAWTRRDMLNTVISVPGPETERLGEKARELNCYICFANYCRDPDWPDHVFNMSVMIGPDGSVIHKHMKAYRGFPGTNEWATTAHDILDEFVERYGWEAVWPVAKTPIGNIASFVCSEGFLPETARMLAMNGAEILIRNTANCSAAFGSEFANPALAMRADCGASHLYGLYANSDGGGISIDGLPMVENTQGGTSMIVDCAGHRMAVASDSREEIIHATIPIASHRKKHKPPMLRRELYAPMYASCFSPVPPNLYSQYLPEDQLDALDLSLKHLRPEDNSPPSGQ